jgi:hypothetical protein
MGVCPPQTTKIGRGKTKINFVRRITAIGSQPGRLLKNGIAPGQPYNVGLGNMGYRQARMKSIIELLVVKGMATLRTYLGTMDIAIGKLDVMGKLRQFLCTGS